ncbi:MAG: transcription antitermination factor NusB [Betaproteobacteria bacterium]
MRTTPRRRARELVLQGLYQRQLSHNNADIVRVDLAASQGYQRADQPYFGELWDGVTRDSDALMTALTPHLDRKPSELSPVEKAILIIGAWELAHRLEIPYKVVINEAVEIAKSFGGTDGHRYVNGVLDKFAAGVRVTEIAALRRNAATS